MIRFNKETGVYELDEDHLVSFISSQEKLLALEGGGVDNWEGYGESIDYHLEQAEKELELGECRDFIDIARIIVKNLENGNDS